MPLYELASRSVSNGNAFDDTCTRSWLTNDHSLALSLYVGVKTAPPMIDQSLSLVVGVNGPQLSADHSLRLSSLETRGSGVDWSLGGFSDEDSTKSKRCKV